jgi:hypothetical protein
MNKIFVELTDEQSEFIAYALPKGYFLQKSKGKLPKDAIFLNDEESSAQFLKI